MARLAILDPDFDLSQQIRTWFGNLGFEVTCFESPTAFLTYLDIRRDHPDLVIADAAGDLNHGWIGSLRDRHLDVPVIIISGSAAATDESTALRAGASDYLPRPLDLKELEVLVTRALRRRALGNASSADQLSGEDQNELPGFIGRSPRVRTLGAVVRKVADTNSNVLICGESGTGKELVARAIHFGGRRAAGAFVAVNCSAIPADLLESELFGYRRGAFTGADHDRDGVFAEANGGTLFLDEIGDMPALLQAKLLRVLQDRLIKRLGDATSRAVDVRIIAATHHNLKRATERREFREDLFFRLCVIKISTPPLRERREDIPLIASHFLRTFSRANRKVVSGFTRDAMDALIDAPWPGNVRELENTVERAVTLCSAPWIDAEDLGLEHSTGHDEVGAMFKRFPTLRQLEREYIRHVLSSTDGKKEDVAAILGIDRKTLYRKEREYFRRRP